MTILYLPFIHPVLCQFSSHAVGVHVHNHHHNHIGIGIVVVVVVVVIVVVVIVVVGGHIDDSVYGYEEKAEEGGDREAGFNLFLACTSI